MSERARRGAALPEEGQADGGHRPVLRRGRLAVIVAVAASVVACAPKIVPVPEVTTPRYPQFMFPTVPADLRDPLGHHERGWRFFQAGDLRNAEREFAAVLKATPGFFPAETGLGDLELARNDQTAAIGHFDRALQRSPTYVPALLGRAEALLALDRPSDALKSLEAAVAADPSLAEVRQRVEVLRFRAAQENLAEARRAAAAGRYDAAAEAYERALGASPDSAFLYRELAVTDAERGAVESALEHFRKAVSLDPSDAYSLRQIGGILESRGDLDQALRVYTQAQTLDPTDALQEKIDALHAGLELAKLPAEYRAINSVPQITRGELAALIGVRLEPLLQIGRQRDTALMTDVRGHWASPWIMGVARAGVMEVFPNHTFQPRAVVRRGDLAQTVSRLLNLIAARRPAAAKRWQASRPKIADLSTAHLGYPAASLAVAAGVMPLFENDTFQLSRSVSGEAAVDAIGRIETLAGDLLKSGANMRRPGD